MRHPLDPLVEGQWARVRARLRTEYGEAAFKNWLKPLTLVALEGGEARLAVPTRFMRDWVRSHYGDRLRALWALENKTVKSVDVVVQAPATTNRTEGVRTEGVRPETPRQTAIPTR